MTPDVATAAALALGWVADEIFGDPQRGHPVAGFGRLAQALEKGDYADDRVRGVLHVTALVGGAVALGTLAERATRRTPWAVPATALACWSVLGGRTLRREAEAVADLLAADDLPGARRRIRSLVGRDVSRLGPQELARACVESVAENTSDAVVAPLFWGSVAGIPGLLGYRAVNTLDAMIGHKNSQYEQFGWAAARLDDFANLVPARLAAMLTAAAAPVVGGSPLAALSAVSQDAHRHPSPNAGQVEAAFAGALGVRLGGLNNYGGAVENRGTLGSGRPVELSDITRATTLASVISAASLFVAGLLRVSIINH